MGVLQCRSTATAFFIWKKKARIELTSAYDGQARILKLMQVAEILSRQQNQSKAYFIHCLRLFSA